MDGVTNPRILDALNTVEIQMGNKYQTLQVSRQRDGYQLQGTLTTFYTIQIQVVISLDSSNARDRAFATSYVADTRIVRILVAIIVNPERISLGVGNIVLHTSNNCCGSTRLTLGLYASVHTIDVPVATLDFHCRSDTVITGSLHTSVLVVDVPVTILNLHCRSGTVLTNGLVLGLHTVLGPIAVDDSPNRTRSTRGTVLTIGNVVGLSVDNDTNTVIRLRNTLQNTALIDLSLNGVNRSSVLVDLSL